ncbi:MAG TPA: hypothetical protein VKP11_06510, partial [Frankiaceae bacterium]|nr:hypothetical protein [Frankiaceae bacterium]
MRTPTELPVPPSREDPVVAAASGLLGGPPGAHARLPGTRTWWTPLRVLLLLTVLACLLGYAQKLPCRDTRNWSHEYQYTRLCYSDVVALYGEEGLSAGKRPYLDSPLGYPVLIGGAMQLASSVAAHASPSRPVYRTDAHGRLVRDREGRPVVDRYTRDDRTARFFDVTAVLFLVAACVAVVCTALTAGPRRPWDAALVALAPGLVLHLLTNWDVLAVAFAAAGMLAWARRAPKLAGFLLGLGVLTKAYPLLLLLPLGLLCWRAGRLRAFGRTALTALGTVVAVLAPVWVLAGSFAGDERVGASAWNTLFRGGDVLGALAPHHGGGTNALLRFTEYNKERPADWDSVAFGLQWLAGAHSPDAFAPVHLLALAGTALLLAAGTVRVLRRRPAVPPAVVLLVDAVVLAAVAVGLPPALRAFRDGLPVDRLSALTLVAFLLLLTGIAALAVGAPRRPRLPQLAFLTMTAFLLTNKVFSPQYVLWMLPLAALARPRWRAFLAWQATEALVLLTRFLHFVYNDTGGGKGIDRGWFVGAVALRDVALAVLAGLVV